MRARAIGVGIVCAMAIGGVTPAQEPAKGAPPEHEMMAVYMVLLKKGPAWTAESTAATKAVQEAHSPVGRGRRASM